MTLLHQIPTELSEEIISYLDNPDLVSISLVSRNLYVVAQPFLFRVVHLTYDGSTSSTLKLFCRTIQTRSDLARYVQTLVLRWISEEEEHEIWIKGRDTGQSTYLGNQHRLLQPNTYCAAASSMCIELSKPPSWIEYLTIGWWKPRNKSYIILPVSDVLLLLYLLPSLQCLDVLAPGEPLGDVTNFIRNHHDLPQGSLPLSFHSLRELRLRCSDGGGFICPRSMFAVFQLHSLRQLNIYHVDMNSPEPLHELATTATSPITHLRIRPNSSSEPLLATILSYPRALTHLELVYTIGRNGSYGPLFGTTLQPLRNTLQQLTIYLSNCPKIRLNEDHEYMIGSLHDWPVLRHVRCPLVVFLGVEWEHGVYNFGELLPKVIVEFVVEVDDFCGISNVVDAVEELLRRKKGYGLDLFRELAVLGVEDYDIPRLQAACAAAGVELVKGVVLWDKCGNAVNEE